MRKSISSHCHDARSHSDVAADAQHKQHDEEKHREELRNEIDFRNRLGICHEGQRDVAFGDILNIDAHDVRQVPEDSEDDEAGQQRRDCV